MRPKHGLLTYTHPWTRSAKELRINWWGLGSSLRLVLSFLLAFYNACVSYSCNCDYSYAIQAQRTTLHTLANCIYVYILQTIILQTAFIPISCKLHPFILRTIILQIVVFQTSILQIFILQIVPILLANCHLANCVFSFQRWAVKYDLIARGVEVDLKSFSWVRTHFD